MGIQGPSTPQGPRRGSSRPKELDQRMHFLLCYLDSVSFYERERRHWEETWTWVWVPYPEGSVPLPASVSCTQPYTCIRSLNPASTVLAMGFSPRQKTGRLGSQMSSDLSKVTRLLNGSAETPTSSPHRAGTPGFQGGLHICRETQPPPV